MCGSDDGWDVEFYREVKRKARKAHRCDECGTLIQPGEHYIRVSQKFDGSVSDWADCLLCSRVKSAYFKAEHAVGHHDATYTRRGLRETIAECIAEEPHFLIAFRAAWKGEPVPKAPPPPDRRTHSGVWA